MKEKIDERIGESVGQVSRAGWMSEQDPERQRKVGSTTDRRSSLNKDMGWQQRASNIKD